jgi:hypothetical protein
MKPHTYTSPVVLPVLAAPPVPAVNISNTEQGLTIMEATDSTNRGGKEHGKWMTRRSPSPAGSATSPA